MIRAISFERSLIKFYKENPDKFPDGSFAMDMFWRGFEDGKQAAREDAARRLG